MTCICFPANLLNLHLNIPAGIKLTGFQGANARAVVTTPRVITQIQLGLICCMAVHISDAGSWAAGVGSGGLRVRVYTSIRATAWGCSADMEGEANMGSCLAKDGAGDTRWERHRFLIAGHIWCTLLCILVSHVYAVCSARFSSAKPQQRSQ